VRRLQTDAGHAVGRGGIFHQLLQRQAIEWRLLRILRLTRQFGQDAAAAFALALDQRHIFGIGAVGRQVARQFLGDNRDGRQRRTQLMRGGGGQRPQGGQLLRAGRASAAFPPAPRKSAAPHRRRSSYKSR